MRKSGSAVPAPEARPASSESWRPRQAEQHAPRRGRARLQVQRLDHAGLVLHLGHEAVGHQPFVAPRCLAGEAGAAVGEDRLLLRLLALGAERPRAPPRARAPRPR
ncbi:hypothetical protein ABXN37_17675 [Piscinibacter sakaiensis]|uniref:hypothetical protein n=1 Tax=Piscinibacter sakaiensis TaxID=1547922 RepID=UPI0037263DB7